MQPLWFIIAMLMSIHLIVDLLVSRTLIDSSDYQVVVSTFCDAAESSSEILNFPPKMSNSAEKGKPEKAPMTSEVTKPVLKPEEPVPTSSSQQADPDPRSSSSYSMEFEEEEDQEEEMQVGILKEFVGMMKSDIRMSKFLMTNLNGFSKRKAFFDKAFYLIEVKVFLGNVFKLRGPMYHF